MESLSSSLRSIPESNLWDLNSVLQNSIKLDDMIMSTEQNDKMQCSICNKKQDTLAKREDLAWQREDMLYTREKELRERELILEEKNKIMIEKEMQLKSKEENILIKEAVCDSKESSRKNSVGDVTNCTSSSLQQVNSERMNGFLLEKERLLQEKEKIISEKYKNIEEKELNILRTEQLLKDQKSMVIRDNELITQKENDFEQREQIIKSMEEALDAKLKLMYEEKKTLDNRENLLVEKENAIAAATEIMQNREWALNERENMIIEKETTVIKQIHEFVSNGSVVNNFDKIKEEKSKKLDEILSDKWKSVWLKENSVNQNELILHEKWKQYSEAKDLLKYEEESLLAKKVTFEKEQKLLKQWEKFLENEDGIEGVDVKKTNKYLVSNKISDARHSSFDVECRTNARKNSNSPDDAEQKDTEFLDISKTAEEGFTTLSQNRAISGDEFFKFFDKETERFQKLLLKGNSETSAIEQESHDSRKCVGENVELTETLKTFFKKSSDINKRSSETKGEHARNVSEVSERIGQYPSTTLDVKSAVILPDDIQTKVTPEISSSINSKDADAQKNKTETIKDSILPQMLDTRSIQNNINSPYFPSPDTETEQKSLQGKSIEEEPTNKVDVILENEKLKTQRTTDDVRLQKNGNKHPILEENRERKEERWLINDKNCKTSGSTRVPSVSLSSEIPTKSVMLPVNGECVPSSKRRQKKPPKDALLQAIAHKNFLETVQLLNTNCICLEIRNNEGLSALLLAVKNGESDLVQRLINKGADIRACDYRGYSALHIAVANNDSDMVLFLLRKGLNPKVTDNHGCTAIQLASNLKHSSLTDILNKYVAEKST